MNIPLPQKAAYIIQELEQRGYEAFAVGGCVRDSILGRCPNDWDITTSALPQTVREIFSHTIDTGLKHGTVTVLLGHEQFEVTTYRIDGVYEDGRHPSQVTFTPSLREDLKRRDFTINAMAYNDRCGLVDCFDGMGDLKKGLIRCVGEPSERFGEDALRILRAVRFGAQLDFAIEERTKEAAAAGADTLRRISAERIHSELGKLLVSPHPERLREAYEMGITRVILPEFDAAMDQPQNSSHHCYCVGEHTIRTIMQIPADETLRMTMLLHDLGKPAVVTLDEAGIYHFRGHARESAHIGKAVLRRLKYDNARMGRILRLVACHSLYPEETEAGVRRACHEIGPDLFRDFLLVKRADTLGQKETVWERKLAYLDRLEEIYEGILRRGDCLTLKELAVTGADLVQWGLAPGPALGKVLEQMLEDVLQDPAHNQKAYLLGRLQEGCFAPAAEEEG